MVLISEKKKLGKDGTKPGFLQTTLLRNEIKHLKEESTNEFLRGLTNDSSTEYARWKTTKDLKKQECKHLPSGNQMEDGLEVISKKLEICRPFGKNIPPKSSE